MTILSNKKRTNKNMFMIKNILSTILFLTIAQFSTAQRVTQQFIQKNSSKSYRVINSTKDKLGNLIYLTSDDVTRVQIIKVDINNNNIFTKEISGNVLFTANAITVDDSNNIWIAGTHRDYADLDPGPSIKYFNSYKVVEMPVWNDAIYILKLNHKGEYQWAKSIDDNQYKNYFTAVVQQIKIGGDGSIHLQGQTQGRGDFNLDPTKLDMHGGNFLVKYSNKLEIQYVWKGGGYSSFQFNTFDIDSFGNCYLATSGGYTQFGAINPNLKDIAIFKISPNGKSIILNVLGSKNIDCVDGLRVINKNQIVYGGRFMDTLLLYSNFKSAGTVLPKIALDTIDKKYTDDIFLCLIDSSGNFKFSKNIGNNYNDYIQDIQVYKNQIYVTGRRDSISTLGGYSPNFYANEMRQRMFISVYDTLGMLLFDHKDAFPINLLYPEKKITTSATAMEWQVLSRNIHIFNDTIWKVAGTVFPSGQTYMDVNYKHKYYPNDTSIYYKITNVNSALILTYSIKIPHLTIPKDSIISCLGGIKTILMDKLNGGDYYEYCTDTTMKIYKSYSPNSITFKIDTSRYLYVRVSNLRYSTYFKSIPIKHYVNENNFFSTSPVNNKAVCIYNFFLTRPKNSKFNYYWHVNDVNPSDSVTLTKDTTQFYFFKNRDYTVSLSSVDKEGNCYSKGTKNVRINCSVLESKEILSDTTILTLYPNPAFNELKIIGLENRTDYIIYTTEMKPLIRGRYNQKIDISELTPGLYHISLNGTYFKFIKL